MCSPAVFVSLIYSLFSPFMFGTLLLCIRGNYMVAVKIYKQWKSPQNFLLGISFANASVYWQKNRDLKVGKFIRKSGENLHIFDQWEPYWISLGLVDWSSTRNAASGGKVETKVLLCRCTLAPECGWLGWGMNIELRSTAHGGRRISCSLPLDNILLHRIFLL